MYVQWDGDGKKNGSQGQLVYVEIRALAVMRGLCYRFKCFHAWRFTMRLGVGAKWTLVATAETVPCRRRSSTITRRIFDDFDNKAKCEAMTTSLITVPRITSFTGVASRPDCRLATLRHRPDSFLPKLGQQDSVLTNVTVLCCTIGVSLPWQQVKCRVSNSRSTSLGHAFLDALTMLRLKFTIRLASCLALSLNAILSPSSSPPHLHLHKKCLGKVPLEEM